MILQSMIGHNIKNPLYQFFIRIISIHCITNRGIMNRNDTDKKPIKIILEQYDLKKII